MKKDKDVTFIEWLGFKKKLDFSQARWVGPIVSTILIVLAVVLILLVLVTFLQASFRVAPYDSDADGSAIRNVGLVLAALFGLPFIVWRSIVAARQVEIADEALFNDKINDAAIGLRTRREITRVVTRKNEEVVVRELEDDLVARAAAIDRLEGLANERNDIAPRIVRLLATYVRGTFPCPNLELTEPLDLRKIPRMDIQKAVDSIGRIYKIAAKVDQSEWRLDLKSCDFDGVNFSNGYYRAADFTGSRFEASTFRTANFEGCYFYSCLLNYGDFMRTNLKGCKFDHAILNRPRPVAGGFVESINMADLTGTSFISADISALDYFGEPKEISRTFGTKDTIVSNEFRRSMPDSSTHARAFGLRRIAKRKKLTEEQKQLIDDLESTGFHNWSPYKSIDMMTGPSQADFYEELGMNHWPYYS